MNRIPIRVGRFIVGEVRGDTFYKRLRASAHFLNVPPAIAFDVSSLNDAERAGARFVQITDAESGRVYRQSIAAIRAKGFRVARGHGEQVALALNEWAREGEPLGEQMTLWSAAR